MWDRLPIDVLCQILSLLSPPLTSRRPPPWFLAITTRANCTTPSYCYAHNPELCSCHSLPLDFVPHPIRLVAPVGGLLLCKLAGTSPVRLALCNPFTRQYRPLAELNTPRSNPAVGVAVEGGTSFYIYVAGGASSLGASNEPTAEMYDPKTGGWRTVGEMPVEFAVRLTVWTPNESVYAGGVIYWVTSARAYSVMGFELATGRWKEVKAPMAARLEWAALVQRRSGRVGLVGGACGGEEGWVWELGEGEEWVVAAGEGEKRLWGSSTRCAGSDGGAMYLFRDLCSEMLVWRQVLPSEQEEGERWEWVWIEGWSSSSSSSSSSSNTLSLSFVASALLIT